MNILMIVCELRWVFRREFLCDSELEPENTLMFKITLIPFGDISTLV